MPTSCAHLADLGATLPRTHVCKACVELGLDWKGLRVCARCGYVGCCETSEGRHAFAHWVATGHPVIHSAEEGETWAWCYVDEVYFGTPTGTRYW